MKMEGFPSTECAPRLVIPAHAGIQVCCGELAWIPAVAGMTDPSGLFVLIPSSVFLKEDTKSTKFGVLIIRTLRVLVIFVVKKSA
jgi:hypothetical protein